MDANKPNLAIAIASAIINKDLEFIKEACTQFADFDEAEIKTYWEKIAALIEPEEKLLFKAAIS